MFDAMYARLHDPQTSGDSCLGLLFANRSTEIPNVHYRVQLIWVLGIPIQVLAYFYLLSNLPRPETVSEIILSYCSLWYTFITQIQRPRWYWANSRKLSSGITKQ